MIANIFHPIITLTITILACFVRKKTKLYRGFAPMLSPRHRPGPPAYSPPQTPSFNCFWLCLEPKRPYFFCIILWLHKLFEEMAEFKNSMLN